MEDYYLMKLAADGIGYITGALASIIFAHYIGSPKVFSSFGQKFEYYFFVLAGAMGCAMLISMFDWYVYKGFEQGIVFSKTIAGAIAGGVLTSEIYKKIFGLSFNTGYTFVPTLCIGVATGRIGAFLIGLRDNTHGIATTLPWGYDYGDGILRHPAQIYEVIVLLTFFVIFLVGISYFPKHWKTFGFFYFVFIYFSYRLSMGFFMPYSHFWWGLNTIQIVSVVMILYSIYKIKVFLGKPI